MPRIKIERVISVSSEDKLHTADNILNTDSNKKWKCKTAGEQNCTVILQLAELTVITGIDIGNEHSAFVEVHVGRTGFNDDDYKVLLMMSSFMTPLDSRQSENINRIRMFKTEDFCKPVCEERWDRVKLICTQPFNRHVQYGLSFITLHSATSNKTSVNEITFGKFKIKTEAANDTIKPGSIFNSIKTGDVNSSSTTVSAAAEIRKASLPSQISKNEGHLSSVKNDKIKKPANASPSSTPSSSQSTPKVINRNRKDILYNDEDDEPSQKVDKVMKNYHDKKQVNGTTDEKPNKKDSNVSATTPSTSKEKLNANDSSSKKRKSSPKVENIPAKKVKKIKTKPFRQLLQGVVFVMSGYQNPQRANLRDMAIKMGAKYKPDWNDDCTHLVCAFKNTPKYNEVRGRGKIVKCDWITECYNQRKRIPWRRYALDNREQIQSDSEEEILDELLDENDDTKDSSSTSNKKRYVVSSDSDTEDEIERIQAAQQLKDNVNDTNHEEDEKLEMETNENEEKKSNENDVYNNDTDIEDEIEHSENVELKPLPEIFSNMKFFIANNLPDNAISELKRYIFAYGGVITNELEDAEYLIIEDEDLKNQLIEDNTSIKSVRPAWIWECNDTKELLDVDHFLL